VADADAVGGERDEDQGAEGGEDEQVAQRGGRELGKSALGCVGRGGGGGDGSGRRQGMGPRSAAASLVDVVLKRRAASR
jgi:hypothetical protein